MFDQKNVEKIKLSLLSKDETISVAESVTNGFVQAALASVEKATQFFQGGITVYNVGQKYRHLLIDPIHALSCNCVSERVAAEMASHVCEKFSSDWGLAITGYASPVPESEGKLFAFYAIAYKGKVKKSGRFQADGGDPGAVKLYYTNHLIEECLKALLVVGDKKQPT